MDIIAMCIGGIGLALLVGFYLKVIVPRWRQADHDLTDG